ncbi:AI-2E family transporter [Anaerosporobacter sp.]|uniref:AI-2E family transporter n=1 Tax=Anaerosporobacter sp. TaxID=1872529 RepID=UPI00286EB881|nr:AI-2E family transporter [Anaerosporobacter sp.]
MENTSQIKENTNPEPEKAPEISAEQSSEKSNELHSHKFQTNRNYFIISIYTLAVMVIGAIIISIIVNFSYAVAAVRQVFNVLTPFIMAFFIAYILNPIVIMLDKRFLAKVLKIKNTTVRKFLAILFSYLIVIGIIAIVLIYIIPELITTLSELNGTIVNLSDKTIYYLQNLEETFPSINFGVVEDKINGAIPDLLGYGTNLLSNIFPKIISISVSIVRIIINLVLSIVISCYMISDKKTLQKNIKRTIYSFVPIKKADSFFNTVKECNSIFNGFIVGKTIDSLIIGIICYVLMRILHLNYAILLSVIVGITNMIPYFGPFIGAVPGTLIFLVIDPIKAFIFAFMILALQQFDGLYLGPKILGESTGLKPLWVIFGITVGGAYWGVLGMFLGVPVTAVIAFLLNKVITNRLKRKNIEISE